MAKASANVELCKETLLPLGIDFKACNTPANIPFQDESFDLIINRHGAFNAKEICIVKKFARVCVYIYI